ncbi:MAG TPA: HNH endonuclease signature motif containing protein [Candidatus Nitrosopolaris sp.]|nr:HNH endonuclease signature motif containing protein [Candidatus Nitrosopolaris sp.]
MSSELGRNVPIQIQRQLKKECSFGCALCGSPLLKYAHIVPYNRIQAFLPENMIALCPPHHGNYDNGDLSESYLRDAKRDPHNKIHPQDAFFVESQDLVINIAKSKFINTHRVLVIDDFDLITVSRDNGKYLLLDINFFDKINTLVATVLENSWVSESSFGWKINYSPQKFLTIQNPQRNAIFEITIENTELFITAVMYYNNYSIRITRNEILLNENEIGTEFKNSVLKNYEVAIAAYT